jgi:hypothetical protein
MIDRTEAKIGRSMKKWERRMGWAWNSGGLVDCHPERSEGHLRTREGPSLRSG